MIYDRTYPYSDDSRNIRVLADAVLALLRLAREGARFVEDIGSDFDAVIARGRIAELDPHIAAVEAARAVPDGTGAAGEGTA